MHENQKWVFQQCVKAYFFRKFADPREGGGGMGAPPPSFQLKKKAMKQDKDERKE